ncbi:hypothetical protein LTR15_009251 [Elasticomyces elasticus]|nr:hypothetical protein LTR15_009251 [Elasticomyces elasticus]
MKPAETERGTCKTDVEGLQLVLLGSPSLLIDGVYGDNTKAAVAAFQKTNWLPVTNGVVNNVTYNILRNLEEFGPVLHEIPFIPQPDKASCWAASTAAISNSSVDAIVSATPQDLLLDGEIRNFSSNNMWTKLRSFADAHGLTLYPPQSWVTSAFCRLLLQGPIIVDMLFDGQSYAEGIIGSKGHFVVVYGCRGNPVSDPSGRGTVLRIQDPSPPNQGKRYSITYFDMLQRYPAFTYNIFQRKALVPSLNQG